jgi:hypothetical protein
MCSVVFWVSLPALTTSRTIDHQVFLCRKEPFFGCSQRYSYHMDAGVSNADGGCQSESASRCAPPHSSTHWVRACSCDGTPHVPLASSSPSFAVLVPPKSLLGTHQPTRTEPRRARMPRQQDRAGLHPLVIPLAQPAAAAGGTSTREGLLGMLRLPGAADGDSLPLVRVQGLPAA